MPFEYRLIAEYFWECVKFSSRFVLMIFVTSRFNYTPVSFRDYYFEDNINDKDYNFGNFTVSKVRMHDDLMQDGLLKKDKGAGKGLSTNDYTTAEKEKLAGLANYTLTKAKVEAVLTGNIASHTHTFASLTSKPTTLSGYGITDAKIANGTITLGANSITPLTSHQSLANYLLKSSYTASDVLTKIKTVDGSGSGLDADLLDGIHGTGYCRAYSASYRFGSSNVTITTAEFVEKLKTLGAFNQPYWMAKGSWDYAGNNIISDTGIGNIQLAGAVVEVMGNSPAYTIRITTAPTTTNGIANAVYIYRNHGNDYRPGWKRLANTDDAVSYAVALYTPRTLTIGSTGKSFDGTASVSWSLAEIGAAAAVSVVDHGTADTTFTLTPDILHKWGSVSTLTLTLAAEPSDNKVHEYMVQFTSPSTATTLSLPSSITWTGGSAPTIKADKTYQISIVNNLAVIGEF